MVSRMCLVPHIHATVLSRPNPKPECGTESDKVQEKDRPFEVHDFKRPKNISHLMRTLAWSSIPGSVLLSGMHAMLALPRACRMRRGKPRKN